MTTRMAVGLVHRPPGTPLVDRQWARALVIRYARERRLRLLDVLELQDPQALGALARRLAEMTASADVTTLVTDGFDPAIAGQIAQDLGLRHAAVPTKERLAGE